MSRFHAPTALADGSAPSYSSFIRTSTDGSLPVVLNQPPSTGVPEQLVLRALQLHAPTRATRASPIGLKQLEQAEDQEGVVFGVAVDGGVRRRDSGAAAVRVAASHIVARRNAAARRAVARCRRPGRPCRLARAPRRRPARAPARANAAIIKPVPAGEHLVVEMRTRPRRARVEQRDARARQRVGDVLRLAPELAARSSAMPRAV